MKDLYKRLSSELRSRFDIRIDKRVFVIAGIINGRSVAICTPKGTFQVFLKEDHTLGIKDITPPVIKERPNLVFCDDIDFKGSRKL